jgi:hypothetical protein
MPPFLALEKDSEEGTPAKKKKRGKSKSIGEKKSKPNGKIEIFIKYLQYVFITLTFIYQPSQVCGHVHVCYRYRFVSVCRKRLLFDASFSDLIRYNLAKTIVEGCWDVTHNK